MTYCEIKKPWTINMFVECYRAALKRPLEEKSQQRGQTVIILWFWGLLVSRTQVVISQLTCKETNFLKKQGNACYFSCYASWISHYTINILLTISSNFVDWHSRLKLRKFFTSLIVIYLRPSILPLSFPNVEIRVYLQIGDTWINIGEGVPWQVFQQMWRVL